jgi:hypothetical protein
VEGHISFIPFLADKRAETYDFPISLENQASGKCLPIAYRMITRKTSMYLRYYPNIPGSKQGSTVSGSQPTQEKPVKELGG